MSSTTRIRQRDSSDCGPACIASVTGHYGKRIPVSRIRQVARTDTNGTSMLGMVRTLEKLDFEAQGLRGSAGHLGNLPCPFIAHLVQSGELHHYVTVFRVGRKFLRIMDPATGTMKRWEKETFIEQWSGSVIVMVPTGREPESGPETTKGKRLLALIQPVWRPVAQAVISAILYTILGLSTSIYLGKLTDHVFITRNEGLLNLMSLCMLGIILLMLFLSALKNVLMLKTGQVIDNQLIASYYRHLFNLPQRFFDSMKSGEILSRINDAVKIRAFINDSAVGIMVNILILLFSFTTMFLLHQRLSLIMLIMIPFYILIYLFFNHRNKRIERTVMEQAASLEDQFVESLGASRHIRQYNLTQIAREKTERRLNRLLDSVYRSGINAIIASTGSEAINRVFTIVLLWTGSFFVIRESMTPGNLLTFYALLGYLTGPVSSLVGANRSYQNAMIAGDRLFEIFQLNREEEPGLQHFKREKFGNIRMRGITFAYGSRGNQLEDVDLTIGEGRITALTGNSGSGKSTISNLVQHLYPPDCGQITINGCDTRYYSRESIRSLMGVIPQQLTFLSGSILENMAPGEAEPDLVKITTLLKQVGLLQLVESLPEGLATVLSDNGGNFSGGERQRLALVRALYRNPLLLIMDEATSSLDPESENIINSLLLALKEQQRTILLITHKTHLAAIADQTYLMEKGRIISETRPNS
ncbi:MAG: peptidase domain-containing ABC transporter [Bacteroidetes bacterium]|nr:peptidase domain-containing ABC transporter [Bacteroidota bacterium]